VSHPRFSIIPAGAVTDRSLEPRDLQVLCLLGRHTDKAGWCTRSQVKMAQELDCSRGSVQNSLDRLSGAGWIEIKRRDVEVEQAGKQPSRSYAYRVLLDRDDYAFESVTRDADDDATESHAENASDEAGCQPVGTPLPTEQHPGANPCVGTRANAYDGTKNDPLERPPLERERDARARDRKARFLVSFEHRWPTAALDDRQRTAYAAEGLTEDEEEPCLAGIAPFLEDLKRRGRKNVPAGWKYIGQKRWTLLDHPKSEGGPLCYPVESPEARGLAVLYDLVGAGDFFRSVIRRSGSVYPRKPVTPRVVALAGVASERVVLNRNQAAAWDEFVSDHVTVKTRQRLINGSHAPRLWPPLKDGTWSTTGPPEVGLSDADIEDFK